MFLWEYTFDWLQLEIARTAKLDPTQNYVVAAYPHGILIHSRVLTFGNLFQTLFPGVSVPRTLAASAIFRIPFARDLALFMGAVDAEEGKPAGQPASCRPRYIRACVREVRQGSEPPFSRA